MSCGKTTGHGGKREALHYARGGRPKGRATQDALSGRAGDRHCSLVAVAMLDADLDGVRDRARQLLRPLDRQHALHPELFQTKIVDLSRVVETVQVDVNERDAPTTILLHQRERRAAYFVRRDP